MKLTEKQLQKVLDNHKLWLSNKNEGKQADLRGADLQSFDLRGANLRDANLRVADLRDANLHGANLCYCVGNKVDVKSMCIEKWDIVYTNEVIAIGCTQHSISELFNMSDAEIDKLDYYALAWWKKWKAPLKKIMVLSGVPKANFNKPKELK